VHISSHKDSYRIISNKFIIYMIDYTIHFRAVSGIYIWGSGPALPAHGSLGLKQEIYI
jgi:hypothetical protein